MTEDDFDRIENMMARQFGVMEENVQQKFDLLIAQCPHLIEARKRIVERRRIVTE